jgi:hypothetical protein
MVASSVSGVVQSVAGMFALKRSGSESKYFWLSEPPVTSIGARFMYISRLPILLNHVQARVARLTVGKSLGMLKVRPVPAAGG